MLLFPNPLLNILHLGFCTLCATDIQKCLMWVLLNQFQTSLPCSEGFNAVSHSLLLEMLSLLGFQDTTFSWLPSSLPGCSLSIMIAVVQDSVLLFSDQICSPLPSPMRSCSNSATSSLCAPYPLALSNSFPCQISSSNINIVLNLFILFSSLKRRLHEIRDCCVYTVISLLPGTVLCWEALHKYLLNNE